jgi:hypothetical protein
VHVFIPELPITLARSLDVRKPLRDQLIRREVVELIAPLWWEDHSLGLPRLPDSLPRWLAEPLLDRVRDFVKAHPFQDDAGRYF